MVLRRYAEARYGAKSWRCERRVLAAPTPVPTPRALAKPTAIIEAALPASSSVVVEPAEPPPAKEPPTPVPAPAIRKRGRPTIDPGGLAMTSAELNARHRSKTVPVEIERGLARRLRAFRDSRGKAGGSPVNYSLAEVLEVALRVLEQTWPAGSPPPKVAVRGAKA